jgi:gliding motility-associated-like protein
MASSFKIIAFLSLMLISVLKVSGQPDWVPGTPRVSAVGPTSITLNYGIDTRGTVYIIVFNSEITTDLTSSYVKFAARFGVNSGVVTSAVLSVERSDVDEVLQRVLNVRDPGQIHTIYIVAENGRATLQPHPVRLVATTLSCPVANAGPGGAECDRNFNLNATPAVGTGTWTKVTGPGNTTFSPGNHSPTAVVSVTEFGTYTLRWTEVTGNCTSSDDVVVVFNRAPNPDAGSGGTVCGLSFDLRAEPSIGTGSWTMTSGTGTAAFSPNANDPDARVTVSSYGAKVFTWTEMNGQCTGSDNVTVSFYQQPVADAGTGGNTCGLEMTLNAVPTAGSGTWTRVSGPGHVTFTPDTHSPGAKVTVSEFGTYVFRWTLVNGVCSSNDVVTVSFYSTLSANAGNGGDECDRNFQLNAIPGTGTGTWSQVGGPGTSIFTPNARQANAVVTVSQYGDYDFAWTEVSFNCSSVDIIRVVFHGPPAVNAGQDASVCKGSTIRLHGTGTGILRWTPANLLSNPAIPDPVATPVVTSIFTLTLTDQWGCLNSDQVRVEVREKPLPNAGPDQLLFYLFETELYADDLKSAETGEWSVISGSGEFEDKNDNITLVTGLSLGTNSLVWTVNNGVCTASTDTVHILINDLLMPTLITPNLDGRNDFFFIKGIETFGKCTLSVFNRWGALVYYSEQYANEWDGKNIDGSLLPEDTYFYTLKPEKSNPIKGYIVIRH